MTLGIVTNETTDVVDTRTVETCTEQFTVEAKPYSSELDKLCVIGDAMTGAAATPTVVDRDEIDGFDCTDGRKALKTTVTMSDGTFTQTFTYKDDGSPMSNNSDFTAQASSRDSERSYGYSTATDSANANYGLSIQYEERTEVVDGVETVTYHSLRDVPAATPAIVLGEDITALIAAAPWNGPNFEEQSVIMPNINLTVTGATPLALPAQATHAGYWRAEINNGSGVVYTTDGTAPTTSPLNGQLAGFGGEIVLRQDEGAAALFLSVGGSGQVDAAASTDLSFEQRNTRA